jgi:hypothetical protein
VGEAYQYPNAIIYPVYSGPGYRLSIGGILYEFPLYDRAPCEGLFTQNYASYVYCPLTSQLMICVFQT